MTFIIVYHPPPPPAGEREQNIIVDNALLPPLTTRILCIHRSPRKLKVDTLRGLPDREKAHSVVSGGYYIQTKTLFYGRVMVEGVPGYF